MTQVTWRRELAWAIGLLGLAVILGFMFHWPLVQASLRGNLTALLDQKRQERREVQFQGVRTLDLAQAYPFSPNHNLNPFSPNYNLQRPDVKEQANRGHSTPGAISSPGFSAPSGA